MANQGAEMTFYQGPPDTRRGAASAEHTGPIYSSIQYLEPRCALGCAYPICRHVAGSGRSRLVGLFGVRCTFDSMRTQCIAEGPTKLHSKISTRF